MVDVELVIKEYLSTAGTPFKTIVGNRIFIDRVHGFNGSSQAGCMFRTKAAGSIDEYLPIAEPLVDFYLYGGSDSFYDCKALYRALNDHLHAATNELTDSGVIIFAKEVVPGQNHIEPDTQWLLTFCTYQLSVRERN